MRIGILQSNPIIAAVDKNLAWIESKILETLKRNRGVELFVSPELGLIGYPARDLLSQKTLIQKETYALERLIALSAELKIGIIVGHTETRKEFVGRAFYNSASLYDCGTLIGRIRKHRIPSYDIFEEERFFEKWPEGRQAALQFRGHSVSLAICEDGWESIQAFGFRDIRSYPKQTPGATEQDRADLYINISASPYSLLKRSTREDLFCAQAQRAGRPLIYANSAGAQDDLLFDGASFAVSAEGKLVAQAALFDEDVLLLDWDPSSKQVNFIDKAHSPKTFDPWKELSLSLKKGLKDFIHKCQAERIVLGLSGGIDSALAALLAVQALGAENVLGVSLPSALTSDLSKKLAQDLAKNLKIEFRELSIESSVSENQKLLGIPASGLPYENLQSRCRGLVLMGIANVEKRFLLATCNKSEIALGYSTLYGDMAGALCPLGDLYKTEVYGLCHYLDPHSKIIPRETLTRAPTAELAPGQKDADALPNYEVLDGFLYEIIENQGETIFKEDVWNQILAPKHSVATLKKKIFAQEFKRRQSSPLLRVHQRSFGVGWRMPIAKEYP